MKITSYLYLLIVTALGFTTLTVHAHQSASGRAMLSVGPYTYQTIVSKNADIDSPFSGGFGILGEGGVDKNGGIELGLFYMDQTHYYRREGKRIKAEKVKRMHITMGYRHWFNPSFSAGLAFSSAYSMGDYNIIRSDSLPSGETATSAQDTTEYGFDASVQWEFWRDALNGALIDARYSHSVTKKPGEYADHIGFMIAYKRQLEIN